MTEEALTALSQADVIAGYSTYTALVAPLFPQKEIYSTGMKKEEERCREALSLARGGKTVALVCSGDAGVYGMASLALELAAGNAAFAGLEIAVVAGVTAALSGAALLGAPLSHDFCVISLSNLLTPQETVERRLRAAAAGDFCMALYNPRSHNRPDCLSRACSILLEQLFIDNLRSRDIEAQVHGKKRPMYEGKLLDRDIHIADFDIPQNSEWAGKTLMQLSLGRRYGVHVSSILRGSNRLNIPDGKDQLFPLDRIQVIGSDLQLSAFREAVEKSRQEEDLEVEKREMKLRQLIIGQDSPFIGKTLEESGIRHRYNCMVVGLEEGMEVNLLVSPFKVVLSDVPPCSGAGYLHGFVTSINTGAVLARVIMHCNGISVVSICTIEHAQQLNLSEGHSCYAHIEPVDIVIEVAN